MLKRYQGFLGFKKEIQMFRFYRFDITPGAFGKVSSAGSKISRKAFEGRLGLRGRSLSGASLMAQQNTLKNR